MSDTPLQPNPPPEQSAPSPWPGRLRAALPYLLTAALAVAISVGIEMFFAQPATLAFIVPTPAPAQPTSAPAPTVPASAPASAAPAPATDIVRQELLDLRAEDARLWAAVYLARAISQISDAESQMRANNLENVAQSLVAVDGSLELAYNRADESVKSPIAELRRTAGVLRDDLYVRPEGMDARLAVLRQTILTLIGERR